MVHGPLPLLLPLLLLLLALATLAPTQANTNNDDLEHDHCEIIKKSLLFYEAQRSGRLPSTNRIPWRGDSALTDCTEKDCTQDQDGDSNLAGGYHNAGGNTKSMLPVSSSMTILAWALIEYGDAVVDCGQYENYISALRWGADWIMKAHVDSDTLVIQVGNESIDATHWQSPELSDAPRPVYIIDKTHPGSDVVMSAASALASLAILMQNINSDYTSQLLRHARELYSMGYTYRGLFSDNFPELEDYKSFSYEDDLVWGSTWLYRATGQNQYLMNAVSGYDEYMIKDHATCQGLDWSTTAAGTIMNMYKMTGDSLYLHDAENWFTSWTPGHCVQYTPGGLAWRAQPDAALRTSTGAAFLALLVNTEASVSWAEFQISYVLGKNPEARSYMIGHGANPPENPHHRASHGSTINDINVPAVNRHALVGAIVGGPGSSDEYKDDRLDKIKNSVGVDYNAGFTAAICALAHLSSTSPTRRRSVESENSVADTAPPSYRQHSARGVTIVVHEGTSSYWLAFGIETGIDTLDVAAVTLTDSGVFNTPRVLNVLSSGYWVFTSPDGTTGVVAPLSLGITAASGATVFVTLNEIVPGSVVSLGQLF